MVVMSTWRRGRQILAERLRERAAEFGPVEQQLAPSRRTPGTIVFLTGDPGGVPPALRRIVRHLHVLPERVILLRVETARVPYVAGEERLQVAMDAEGTWRVSAQYGFLERPDVPTLLHDCRSHGLFVQSEEVTYVLGRETLLATDRAGMARWRERLFARMSRNAADATDYFRIPASQVLEIGSQIEL
jgi:KUP system potassium uptake protein